MQITEDLASTFTRFAVQPGLLMTALDPEGAQKALGGGGGGELQSRGPDLVSKVA